MKSHVLFLTLLFIVTVFILPCSTSASVKSPVFDYDSGLISLRTNQVGLISLLERIADAAGIEIYIAGEISGRTNKTVFDQKPLQDVLETLLRGYSYAVIYSKEKNDKGQVLHLNVNQSLGGYNKKNFSGSSNLQNSAAHRTEDIGLGDAEDRSTSGDDDQESVNIPFFSDRFKQDLSVNDNSGFFEESESEASGSGGSAIQEGASEADDAVAEGEGVSNEDSVLTAESQSPDPDDSEISDKQLYLQDKIEELEEYIQSGKADEFYTFWTEEQGRDPQYVYNPWKDLEKQKEKLEQLN